MNSLWLVERVYPWPSRPVYIAVEGNETLTKLEGFSVGFALAYETRDAALAAADGNARLVIEVKEVSRA